MVSGTNYNGVKGKLLKSQSDHVPGSKEMHLSYGWSGEGITDAKKQRRQYPSVHQLSRNKN